MSWTKESDWLPLQNAIGRVRFWKKDLKYAEDELDYVEKMIKQYPTLNLNSLLEEALKDVVESREGLTRARFKLEESKKLE